MASCFKRYRELEVENEGTAPSCECEGVGRVLIAMNDGVRLITLAGRIPWCEGSWGVAARREQYVVEESVIMSSVLEYFVINLLSLCYRFSIKIKYVKRNIKCERREKGKCN